MTFNNTYGEQNGSESFTIRPPTGYAHEKVEQAEAFLEEDLLEPVAIVGFSFRFPQDATSTQSFWEMLVEKRNAMTEWPEDRLKLDSFYHPEIGRKENFPVRGAHFLKESPELFDPHFFSITAKEACSMDPQQRGLLELAYTALENAGIPMETTYGSSTSVFTGCFHDDYKSITAKDPEAFPTYAATGLSQAMLANRISWFFNLTGTSVNLDSACSSSMIALDMAVQGLRMRDSNMALVGGTNSILGPDSFLSLTNMNFLSTDSLSYSFDERANGYSKGEGHCIVVLKRLSDAIRDGNTIRAVIRSTGSNQDGRTPGITQPSAEGQEALIRATYRKAGLTLSSTNYVEAHGTGTALGDPIEAKAIRNCFGDETSARTVYIGAVKSNIGHLEGASGLAGLVKTVLILEQGIIPPNANFQQLNNRIGLGPNIKIPEHCTPWPTTGLRRASVNCFGFGGANSHVVLDDAYNFLRRRGLQGFHCTLENPSRLIASSTPQKRIHVPTLSLPDWKETVPTATGNRNALLFVFSAADESGLARLSALYHQYLDELLQKHGTEDLMTLLNSLAYTLCQRRSRLQWRSFISANSISELRETAMAGAIRAVDHPRLGFIFTGQGAQYAGMATKLLRNPIFGASLDQSQHFLTDLGCSWSINDILLQDEETSLVNMPQYSQPLCTAIQIALVDLLRAAQLTPSMVTGHSSGEIAAAYCIGALSHRCAIKIAFHRGSCAALLSSTRHVKGSMMAVGLSSDSVRKYLPGDGSLCVGCVNSPKSVTVSGDCSSIPATEAELTKDGIFTRRLKVNVAYHSHHMNDIADIYRNSIQDLKMDEVVDARMISTVTGNLVTREDICNPEYWVQNMISPVLFSEAASKLIAGFSDIETSDMVNHFPAVHDIVEIGPHSALRGPIGDIIAAVIAPHDIGYHSLLVRGQSELYTLTKVIGALFCRGYSLNIDRYNRPSSNELVPTLVGLPEYPFNHSQRYWHESRLSKEGWRFRRAPLLDLLGSPVPDWNPREARWRRIMKTSQMPWIQDHVINGVAVYPASGMIVMAIEAIRQLAGSEGMPVGYSLKDVMFKKPMSIPAGEDGIETQLHLRSLNVPSDKVRTWCQFRVFSYGNENWTEHCSGNIRIDYDIARNEPHFVEEIMKHTSKCQDNYQRMATQCSRTVSSKFIYEHLNSCGFQYGPTFQALQEVAGCETTESVAHVRVFDGGNGSANVLQPHIIHPITLDAVAQLMLIALTRTGLQSIPTTVPTSVPNLWVSESGLNCSEATTIVASSTAKFTGRRKAESRTVVFDEQHQRVLLTMDIETTAVTTNTNPFQSSASSQLCYRFALKPDINLLSQRELSTLASVARPRRSSMSRFYAELEIAQQSLMKNAVAAIDNHCPTDLQPHHQLYIRWARTRICHTPSDLGGFRTLEDLYRSVESSGTQGKLFMTLGRVLEDALRGDVDPLQILFSEDDLLAARYYEYCNQDLLCNEPLIEILQFMAHKNPRLKVLEIGAGTGAATSIAIQALSDQEGGAMFTSYDYTDTSPSFFDAAEEKFGWCSKAMNFRVLDIDYAPSDQGYQSGMYDLIIAGGVLHATQDLQRTLIHVRSLLKPGGKLVLYEIVQNSRWIQFAFGLLPGWWQSTDDYRIEGPCVGVEKWDQLLKATGFTGVDVDIPDFEDPACHQFSIMLSTAVEPKPGTDSKITRNIVIVLAQDSPSQCQLAHSIYKEVKALGQPDCEILKLQQAVSYESSSKPLFLLLSDFGEPFLADIDATSFNQLQQFIARAHQILWVYPDLTNTSNPQSSMIEGFSRVLRSEFETLDLTLLALASYDTETLGVHCVIKVLREMSSNADYEPEYVVKDNLVHIRRLVEDHSLSRRMSTCGQHTTHQMKAFGDGPPLILDIATPGLLDSLEFIEDPDYKSPLGPLEIEIAVQATGINFRDCLTALGQIDGKVLGGECAGRVTAIGSAVITDLEIGDCVIGCEVNTFRTLTRCIPERVTKVPPGMSFAEAASIPITFVTAHYSFYHVARLQPGESVLIHLGAGATGQAAIQIAKHIRAVVYTTVGSEKKKQMLSEEYGIPADHIFYSRNTSFADAIRRKTEGRGVDVVLNSLAGESMYASWDCLAPFGRFVEIGKKDVLDRSQLPMFNFSRNTAFAVVDLSLILLERPSLARESLEEVLQMMKDGRLHVARPLTVYGVGEIGTAFRSLQSGQNMGKMVIELRSDDIVKTNIRASPPHIFESDASYLIAGGFGGLGRSVARWMASRGAKHLILLSRRGPSSDEAHQLLDDLRDDGVEVFSAPCDICSPTSLSQTIEHCLRTMPPIRGCIQSSMVLKDATFEKMTLDDWKTSVSPKVEGSWNLHSCLPMDLDFFVFLSSVSGITGLGGQTNYAAGNTYIDALAKHRLACGQPASTLNLGWMASEGVVAGNDFLEKQLRRIGYFIPISTDQFHTLLELHCAKTGDNKAVRETAQNIIGLETPLRMARKGAEIPAWMSRKIFCHLKETSEPHSSTGLSTGSQTLTEELLSSAETLSECAKLVSLALAQKVATLIEISEGDIDIKKSLHDYGVDSLFAIEIKSWAKKVCHTDIAVMEMMSKDSIYGVGEFIASKSPLCSHHLS